MSRLPFVVSILCNISLQVALICLISTSTSSCFFAIWMVELKHHDITVKILHDLFTPSSFLAIPPFPNPRHPFSSFLLTTPSLPLFATPPVAQLTPPLPLLLLAFLLFVSSPHLLLSSLLFLSSPHLYLSSFLFLPSTHSSLLFLPSTHLLLPFSSYPRHTSISLPPLNTPLTLFPSLPSLNTPLTLSTSNYLA